MIAFAQARAAAIPQADHRAFLHATIESARRRIWAGLFLFDTRPSRDLAGHALDLATALIERRRAGVDVRILLAGQLETPDIAAANLATGILLDAQGVPQRRVFTTVGDHGDRQGSHAKYAIVDDLAIVGSTNWTDDAFRLNVEDSVLLKGQPVDQLAGEFLRMWDQGRGLPRDAAE